MTFRVTILGSSSALPTPKRNPSAHALNVHEQFFLIDCGEGTQKQLRIAGINPLKLNAVFITHLHGDHLYGIFGLLSTMGLMGRRTPLQIYAPRPFDEILEYHLRYFGREMPFPVEWKEVHTRNFELLYENKTLEVYSVPLRHPIPTAGFLFREKSPGLNLRKEAIERYELGIAQRVAIKQGADLIQADGTVIPNQQLTYRPYSPRSYAYLSDTLPSARAAQYVHGVDLLYHEATFSEEDKAMTRQTGHSTARDAAQIALKAEAGKLLIGHFSSRYKTTEGLVAEATALFPNTEAVIEGNSYEIAIKHTDLHPVEEVSSLK